MKISILYFITENARDIIVFQFHFRNVKDTFDIIPKKVI